MTLVPRATGSSMALTVGLASGRPDWDSTTPSTRTSGIFQAVPAQAKVARIPNAERFLARPISLAATIAVAAFSLGVASMHTYGHYTRLAECQRWQGNVNRWTQVVADATGDLKPAETVALTLAHGAMIAVRDQACR